MTLTSSQLRNLPESDISLLMRETDDPDTLFLLSLVREENQRKGTNRT